MSCIHVEVLPGKFGMKPLLVDVSIQKETYSVDITSKQLEVGFI